MSVKVFLDTNVLVYAFDGDSPAKQAAARTLLEREGTSGTAVLSTQVLQEFYVATTRKLARPLSPADAEQAVQDLAEFPVVRVETATVLAAIRTSRREQVSLWDALIIQCALDAGCARLLTEDLQHGREFDRLVVENPFR